MVADRSVLLSVMSARAIRDRMGLKEAGARADQVCLGIERPLSRPSRGVITQYLQRLGRMINHFKAIVGFFVRGIDDRGVDSGDLRHRETRYRTKSRRSRTVTSWVRAGESSPNSRLMKAMSTVIKRCNLIVEVTRNPVPAKSG
jgi:hypothetical protein